MSSLDRWGDVRCPSCGEEALHAWHFDPDCRGNKASSGVDACRKCGFLPRTDKEIGKLVNLLWG